MGFRVRVSRGLSTGAHGGPSTGVAIWGDRARLAKFEGCHGWRVRSVRADRAHGRGPIADSEGPRGWELSALSGTVG
eukprot:CAMPEP_0180027876 /NCGR_PEP_ID=MMETSP0984-20121128/25983_1 /TAXON_ID=483367 /ORGANISM="non described non described, Strain CCMP 2436" /LENGTH=76 /DNA_ID=CAMNT_0021952725 /DNA_START=86 /DNA_END=316 /DNA_ORIENTATION=-